MTNNADGARPVGITLGDPSGVGPEITLRAFKALAGDWNGVIFGDARMFCALAASGGMDATVVGSVREARPGQLSIIDIPAPAAVVPGQAQPENAASIVRSIEMAVRHVQQGDLAAIVTNPINKAVLVEGAAFPYPGHTEFLAALDRKAMSVMMLAAPELRVVPVTIHLPLRTVPELLTPDLIGDTIRTVAAALRRDFAIGTPRIAVAGLNPHAGENGLMGHEDARIIAPVLAELRTEGMDIAGPMSADTMFHGAARARYDCAICMYHDQALIPIKTLAFDQGVNATLGLSFIRTSPDHGTAFDIAGTGQARPDSLIMAIEMAGRMARNRQSAR